MKYRFEVTYQNKILSEVCRIMKNLDLDMGQVCIQEVFTFSAKDDVNPDVVKNHLKDAIESCELIVFKIEGGKVE